MNTKYYFALAAMSALSVSGCAGSSNSQMDTGERIAERGSQISDYGQAWTDGKQDRERGDLMVETSRKDAEKAGKKLADARAEVAAAEAEMRTTETNRLDGEKMIADGTTKMQRAEADYAAIRAGPSANASDPGN